MAQPGRTIVIVLSDGATPNSIAMFGLLSFPFDFHQILHQGYCRWSCHLQIQCSHIQSHVDHTHTHTNCALQMAQLCAIYFGRQHIHTASCKQHGSPGKTHRNRTIHPIFLDHMPTRTHTQTMQCRWRNSLWET